MNRMSSFASFCSKAIAIGKIEVCVQLQSDNVLKKLFIIQIFFYLNY